MSRRIKQYWLAWSHDVAGLNSAAYTNRCKRKKRREVVFNLFLFFNSSIGQQDFSKRTIPICSIVYRR